MTVTATANLLPATPSPTGAANDNARAGGRVAWYRNYHRYYDPGTGRYIQPDPLGTRGLNIDHAFAYAGGNPVVNTDRLGLFFENPWAEARSIQNQQAYFAANPSHEGPMMGAAGVGLLAFPLFAALGELFGAVVGVGVTAAPAAPATVQGLIDMMNRRPGVTAEIATGDAAAWLQRVGAEGSHMMCEGGRSSILLRDGASRWTAFHEWLHRFLQLRNGGPRPGEDQQIESFLQRHKDLFKL